MKYPLLSLVVCMGLAGCATTHSAPDANFTRVEYGRPNKVVDSVGWVVGIPNKIVLWNRKIDNHNVSPETVAATEAYLDYNGLDDVKIRVNQYDPAGEWKRLTQNHRIAPGWRYTFGTMHLIGYTLVPRRIIGGDVYNPYTNSIYIFSDVPEMPIAEAGYAKDIHNRSHPGLYAFVNELPVANMWHESIATKDVLGYVHEEWDFEDQVPAQHLLSARYGQKAGQSFGALFSTTIAIPLELGGAAIGHVTGRLTAPKADAVDTELAKSDKSSKSSRKPEPQAEPEPDDSPTTGDTGKIEMAGYRDAKKLPRK